MSTQTEQPPHITPTAPAAKRFSPGIALSRLAFVLAPLLGYTLVEVMNYNAPWTGLNPVQILLNLAWYFTLAWVVYLMVGRLTLSAGISAGLFVALGLANRYVIRFRGRTIFPGDLLTLRTAANVAGRYDYTPDALQITALVVLAAFCIALTFLPRRRGRQLPRPAVSLSVSALAIAFVAAFFTTNLDTALGIEPSMWTTRGNGFVLNFAVCAKYSKVKEPEGYSPAALAAIAEETVPAAGGTAGVQPQNLIVVMNEAFSDLSAVADLPMNQDPLPFWHGLTENTVRGTAYASVFGGTTANSEYEFLTGNTMAFLPDGMVPFHMYVRPDSPSLVGQMKDQGYHTVALHPYLRSGWNRVPVYRDFGFEQALFQDEFQNKRYMRDYVTDRSNYENVIRLCEAQPEGEPLFVFNVTMQNHSAYNVAWKNLPKTVWLTEDMAGKYATVDQYLSLLKQSDDALKYLLDYFSAVDEPTMICVFGDHQPQLATNFYTDVLGGRFESLPVETQQKRQAVPFAIWANYDIEEQAGLTISLNYLSALLMDTAKLETTGYQDFLSALQREIPAINALGVMDPDGRWTKQESQLPKAAQTALNEYKMLQYNQLFDPKNRLEGFFTLTP